MPKRLPAFQLAILVSLTGAAAWAAGTYEDAVKQYFAGHYQQAAVDLARVCGSQPGNALAHYYLANSLVRLHQNEGAIEEFRICYALEPHGAVSDYCRLAVQAYRHKLPDEKECETIRSTANGGADKSAGAGGTLVKPAAPENRDVQGSLALIKREVTYEKQKHQDSSERTAQEILAQAHSDVDQIHEETEEQVRCLYRPKLGDTIATVQERANLEAQIRAAAKNREERVLRQAQEKAERYRKTGQMTQAALDQVAANLEQQMSDQGHYSGVKLIPERSDLYVRNYVSVTPVRALPDAHPAIVRIYAERRGSSSDAAVDDGATAAQWTAQPIKSSKSVRGKVLKQPN